MTPLFCLACGDALVNGPVAGEDRDRLHCQTCGFILYQNPRVVVNAVTVQDGKLLLIRRGIEPRLGFWALPGGFMELNERAEDGAIRETREETGLEITIDRLLGVYTRVEVGIVNIVYLASIRGGSIQPTVEAPEIHLVAAAAIPFDELAYSSHRWAIDDWLRS